MHTYIHLPPKAIRPELLARFDDRRNITKYPLLDLGIG